MTVKDENFSLQKIKQQLSTNEKNLWLIAIQKHANNVISNLIYSLELRWDKDPWMLQKQDSNPIKRAIPQKNRNDAIQSKRKQVIICKNTHPNFHCLKWNSDYRKKKQKNKKYIF